MDMQLNIKKILLNWKNQLGSISHSKLLKINLCFLGYTHSRQINPLFSQ